MFWNVPLKRLTTCTNKDIIINYIKTVNKGFKLKRFFYIERGLMGYSYIWVTELVNSRVFPLYVVTPCLLVKKAIKCSWQTGIIDIFYKYFWNIPIFLETSVTTLCQNMLKMITQLYSYMITTVLQLTT